MVPLSELQEQRYDSPALRARQFRRAELVVECLLTWIRVFPRRHGRLAVRTCLEQIVNASTATACAPSEDGEPRPRQAIDSPAEHVWNPGCPERVVDRRKDV